MTKKQKLLGRLEELAQYGDTEHSHIEADKALLDYINDKEIGEAFDNVKKWYA